MAPPVKRKTAKTKKKAVKYSDEDLKKALKLIREKKRGIRETCRLFNIPRSTIQDRLTGRREDNRKPRGPDPVLGVEGEKQVKEWLSSMAKCGFPVTKQELLDTVQKIVKEQGRNNPFKDDRPGQTWYFNFLKRNPDLSYRAGEGIKKARNTITEKSIRTWFKDLTTYLAETNNQHIFECPERIFNGGDSAFSICPKTGEVLKPQGYTNLHQVKLENEQNNLTIFVILNANAQVSPPLVVFPYMRPPRAVVESVPEEWCIGKSENGCIRSDVFYEYVTNDFNNWVAQNGIRKPILLLVDGHKSHLSLELSAMCEKLEIIMYALPPNSKHLLHPTYLSVFAPLTFSWEMVVGQFLSKPENINTCLNKINFCHLFLDILEDANMNPNIEYGFRQCGLYPFNPDAIDYTKCGQNTVKIVRKKPAARPKEITNEDLARTRKVLTHLTPILHKKNINVDVILTEIHKLQTTTTEFQVDFEEIIDSGAT